MTGGLNWADRGLSDMTRFLFFNDSLSTWVGKAFAWLILILTLGISYEVFVRYVLRAPTTWAFDFSYITYGALFLMAGAYTLVRNQHVRADVIYRFWRPRTQAMMDLVLYILFFLPAVLAFMYSEVIRCVICIRQGSWPQRLHDVEETESAILHEQQFQRERGEPVQPLPGQKETGA